MNDMAADALGEQDLHGLMAATAAGDMAAFRALYDATSAKLFGVAMRILRNDDKASDAVQQAYEQIWRQSERYNPALGSPRAWMIGILRFRALDLLRRDPAARERDIDGIDPQAAVLATGPGVTPEGMALAQCLEKLPPAQRSCILQAHYAGFTHDELAARLEKPLGTIKSWIRRGLAALKSCLEQ